MGTWLLFEDLYDLYVQVIAAGGTASNKKSRKKKVNLIHMSLVKVLL